jgi:hypothetical protein
LADGIEKLVGALAKAEGEDELAWAAKHELSRYFSSSIKGTPPEGGGAIRRLGKLF